jgi:hypothetical protein
MTAGTARIFATVPSPRRQDGFADRPDAREVRTIEIVLVPDRRTGGGWLRAKR